MPISRGNNKISRGPKLQKVDGDLISQNETKTKNKNKMYKEVQARSEHFACWLLDSLRFLEISKLFKRSYWLSLFAGAPKTC